MSKPLTVRDRHGRIVERPDGKLLDGDNLQAVRVPMMFTDGAATVSAATLASAAVILGDSYDEVELASLSDQAARHAVVRKRLGMAADGRGAAFLDAAWGSLAVTGDASSKARPIALTLTDEQVARGREGVRQALADSAKLAPGRASIPSMLGSSRPSVMTDADRRAANDRTRGSYIAMKAELADAWRGGSPPETKLDARTEAMFRSGQISDTPVNRARAEMAQQLQDGWKAKV